MGKEEKELKIQNLVIYYFVCAFIGWILEMIYGYMVFGHFVDRGFLYGPMCPIYGYGAVAMIVIIDAIQSKNVNTAGKFLIITIVFTLLEYLASLVLELLFHQRWWDYTNEILNINGRVCLIFSLMFGIIGLAFAEFIYKPSEKLISKIRQKVPTKFIWLILFALVIASNVDTIFSIIKYI